MVKVVADAFLLDLGNMKIRFWLTVDDWEEIQEEVPILPHVNQVLVKSLEPFNQVSIL